MGLLCLMSPGSVHSFSTFAEASFTFLLRLQQFNRAHTTTHSQTKLIFRECLNMWLRARVFVSIKFRFKHHIMYEVESSAVVIFLYSRAYPQNPFLSHSR